jgi:AP-1 complex subunit gamma-1
LQVTQTTIIDLLSSILSSPYSNALSTQFVLTALIKLSARFAELSQPDASQIARIRGILQGYDHTQELELQQRSVEYGSLAGLGDVGLGVLERMPMPEIRSTIMGGTASEKRKVGNTETAKDTVSRWS